MHMYLHIESVMWKRKQLHKAMEDKLKSNGGILVILGHIRLSVNFYGIYFGMKSRFLLGFENITAVNVKIRSRSTPLRKI